MLKKDTINKITASWEPIGKLPTIYPNSTFKMRKMQSDAYKELHDKHNIIINAPTASRKTLAICWIIAKHLSNETKRKAIISVPQTIIADGFRGYCNLQFTDESDQPVIGQESINKVQWCPIHYLCSDNKESNESQIISFLNREGNINDINDRVLICSHASLIDAFQKEPNLFKNIDICIDEAHHIRYSVETFEEAEEDTNKTPMEFCNQMGSLVSYAIKHDSIRLILSTATMFRGDRLEVIPQKYNDKFTRFFYPMDEYLRDCHWLKEFSYDFAMYEDTWGERLKNLFKDNVGKTIVYLPNVGSRYYSYGTKQLDLIETYKSISGNKELVTKELDNGLTLIKRGNEWVKVVNLVDDSNQSLREKRKKLIIEAHKHNDNSLIDLVVTLNMFREGANWKWADREIIIGSKGSMTDMNQIIGRLLRDAENKKHVHAIQLLPFAFDQLDKDKFKYNLNEYSKVIFYTMLFEDSINPVSLKMPLGKNNSNPTPASTDKKFRNYLREQVQDENVILNIWQDIRNEAIEVQDNGKVNFGINNETSRKKFAEIASSILSTYGVKNYHSEIAESIRKRWIVESLKKVKGINLDHVDFDIINVNPLDFWLTYSSGMCGLDTYRKFREAINQYCFLTFEEARKYARGLGINGYEQWKLFCKENKKPNNIPIYPNSAYNKNGWVSWGDWLGTGSTHGSKRRYISFEEAKMYVKKLSIKNKKEWGQYCMSGKKPQNIPNCPDHYYKNNGWVNYCDFLNNGRVIGKQCVPYNDAKKIASKLCLRSGVEWSRYCQSNGLPHGVPHNPDCVYKNNGWKGWGEWLGRNKAPFMDFKTAREYVIALKLSCQKEWQKFCKSGKRPDFLPSSPERKYKNKGWNGWDHFLGTGRIPSYKQKYTSLVNAIKIVKSLKIKSVEEWKELCRSGKKPYTIPKHPDTYYKKQGWISWGNFLGTNRVYRQECIPFENARKFVRTLNLHNRREWIAYCKSGQKPDDIPLQPWKKYFKKGWNGLSDWLGELKKI